MGENFTIVEEIAVLSERPSGERKEINRVSWFGKPPAIDIRSWTAGREKPLKGISLTDKEAEILRNALESVKF